MQMDWTTFLLEIINFLVLVWLLRRFFYRPVLAVIDARQARVQAVGDEAAALRKEAGALKAQYETRLADWAGEREKARQQLEQELTQERSRRLDELKRSLADEEAKSHARLDAAAASREAALCRQATADAYAAAAAMLQRLASPALTARIAEAFAEDLATLPADDRETLRQAAAALADDETVEIASAHTLDAATQAAIRDALAQAAGRTLDIRFVEQTDLIGGLRAAVGQCRLDANLTDELAFFRREAARD